MPEARLYPSYIPRDEEQQILAAVERVRETRQSRAVLLYGAGGVGKTRLVRALAERQAAAGQASWLPPIDVDDPEHWLLASLQGTIARQLDPVGEYFGRYLRYLAQLPAYSREQVSAETALSRIDHVRRVFRECYEAFAAGTGKPIVITFDTVEAIRGTDMMIAGARWMRPLPDTLFILSGRPAPAHGLEKDPIEEELASAHQPMPVTTVPLAEFSMAAASRYLAESEVAAGIDEEEKAKLIRLTRGHPLWLALTVAYLDDKGSPEEAKAPLATIDRDIPYRGELPKAGQQLQDDFKRRLLSPYKDTDFWHEAIKRLAVVRRGVNEAIWQQLMADCQLPGGAEAGPEAWSELLAKPWIRPRANRRYVTLHDAMAEELSKRVITLHDGENRQWRRGLWQRAVKIYDTQVQDQEQQFTAESRTLESRRRLSGGRAPEAGAAPSDEQPPLLSEEARLDAAKRELDQLKVAGLEYQLLSDFAAGCQHFLELFAQARDTQDLLFQDLLATAMRRYLPSRGSADVFDHAVGGVVREFHAWLASEQRSDLYRDIGAGIAEYLVMAGHGAPAVDLLRSLPLGGASAHQLTRHNRLLGNAYMRARGQVKEGLPYLLAALSAAEGAAGLDEAEKHRLIAEAHKELGFYYRSIGLWLKADRSYEQARDAISVALTQRKSVQDRLEMASIQTNWAYVKALGGYYRDGLSLVESAIRVRDRLGDQRAVALSHSTRGEVYRYQQQFRKAWEAYRQAEGIFERLQDQSRLGSVYQTQAICLFQAYLDGTSVTDGTDPVAEARDLALKAVAICRERSVRGYPAALNRAGRIVGYTDTDDGLRYLAAGIDAAREMSDGWFWLANLVEYAELAYRAWVKTGDARYRDGISEHAPQTGEALAEYEYPDLRGRWEVVCGHLAIHDWAQAGDGEVLDLALRKYTEGFGHIAERGHVGSSGTSVIPGAFRVFGDLFSKLPRQAQEQWLDHLRRAWYGSQPGSTMLLALLEQLY